MTPDQHNVLSELTKLGLQRLQEVAREALTEAQKLVDSPEVPPADE